jgi:hypothetical protein
MFETTPTEKRALAEIIVRNKNVHWQERQKI